MDQQRLITDRLHLRKFELSDAKRVQQLAGAKEVADVTANIPHPYLDGMAEQWISSHAEWLQNGTRIIYAITLKESSELIGSVGLLNLDSETPELGYWMGLEYWNKGYCTEACSSLIDFFQESFNPEAIFAKHLVRNPASGKVLLKCGLIEISRGYGRNGLMEEEEAYIVYKKEFS